MSFRTHIQRAWCVELNREVTITEARREYLNLKLHPVPSLSIATIWRVAIFQIKLQSPAPTIGIPQKKKQNTSQHILKPRMDTRITQRVNGSLVKTPMTAPPQRKAFPQESQKSSKPILWRFLIRPCGMPKLKFIRPPHIGVVSNCLTWNLLLPQVNRRVLQSREKCARVTSKC